MAVALKWVMRSCIGVVSVGRDTVRNVLWLMERSRGLVYAQTAKRFMKRKKTTGAGNSRPIETKRNPFLEPRLCLSILP